jgi:hypothetical protein
MANREVQEDLLRHNPTSGPPEAFSDAMTPARRDDQAIEMKNLGCYGARWKQETAHPGY